MAQEVPRVPPPYDRGGVKKESTPVDKEQFKKMVEEVRETEAEGKGKRKHKEEETEEEKARKAGAEAPAKKAKEIEGVEKTPYAVKKVTRRAVPRAEAPPPPGKAPAPIAGFKAEEIEEYAWHEEAETLPTLEAGPAQLRKAARPEEGPEIAGEAPQKFMGAKPSAPPPTEAPPSVPPQAPEPFAEAEAAIGGKIEKEEAPPPLEKYTEEWPKTTAFRPSHAFRSLENPSEAETPEPEKREVEKRKEATKKRKEQAHEAGLPGKKEKAEKPKTFAEIMEEGEEKKAAKAKEEAKPAAVKKELEGAPPPKEGVKAAATERPPAELAAEEAAAAGKAPAAGILPAEETFPSLKKPLKTTISPEKAKKEEEGAQAIPAAMKPTPEMGAGLGGEGGGEEKREKEKEKILPLPVGVPEMGAPPPHIEAPAPTGVSPYAQMSPQILALFERMVGVMTIIQTTGVTETVMTLNARQFAGSVLYGSQVVIREFSSAPTRFNVEFIGSPEALSLVRQNVPALMGAVQQGNYNFSINRFDVKLAPTEKPIFTRKEAPEERGEGEEKEKERENR